MHLKWGGGGGDLQLPVVDSGSAESDIIPQLLPQEIRSQRGPWPRCTSTQLNAFI